MDTYAYLLKYLERFGEGFPTYQLARGRSDEEVIGMIKECLNAGKSVYDLGYLDEDDQESEY